MIFDAVGNLYIADTRNHRVRRIGINGVITTVAGNGTAGCSGDGGLAVNAQLNAPQNIAFDAGGNLARDGRDRSDTQHKRRRLPQSLRH